MYSFSSTHQNARIYRLFSESGKIHGFRFRFEEEEITKKNDNSDWLECFKVICLEGTSNKHQKN